LTVQAVGSRWAIPSGAVGGIEPFDATDADATLDLLALLGAAAAPLFEAWRVLVLDVAGEQRRLLVRGALELCDVPAQSLLPLPAALTLAAPLVTHVALVDGKPSLLVVSPERLLRASPADAGSRSVTSTTLPEAPSC
jgi:hypothetical protein